MQIDLSHQLEWFAISMCKGILFYGRWYTRLCNVNFLLNNSNTILEPLILCIFVVFFLLNYFVLLMDNTLTFILNIHLNNSWYSLLSMYQYYIIGLKKDWHTWWFQLVCFSNITLKRAWEHNNFPTNWDEFIVNWMYTITSSFENDLEYFSMKSLQSTKLLIVWGL